MKTHRKCRGFTLVELLVVMSIIAMLVALLLPAVNAARESSRGVVCANNLRQFGIGMHEHASRHGTYCTGAWNWSEDGCVTEKGWVADLVNSGIPVGEMRCPSNPTQVSEVFNQLLTLAPAPTDNCTNYAGTPGKTLPSGALLLNVCRNIINNNVAPLSAARKALIEKSLLEQHYNTNYVASWFLVRGDLLLDQSGNPRPQNPTCANTTPKSLNVCQGPLRQAMLDVSKSSAFVPFLADGPTSHPLAMPLQGIRGEFTAKSYTNGPVLKSTLLTPSFPNGTLRDGPNGWWAKWNNETLQDYRPFTPVHRNVCNILFADGSVRTVLDQNRDGYLNNGFPAGNGFADNNVEMPLGQVHSLYSLTARNPVP